jgi:diaminohydroxyphosphoribosylaminopyrimidine deaminase/5-amino-6-(5-phosphoribosylamino)uracil reductase
MVGAVLVSKGRVIGEGWHRKAGEAHAEEAAIRDARTKNPGKIPGSTLYCTLEPCSFTAPDKKRPPCTKLIIESGIKRAVIAALDPNPRVNGAGAEALRAAGIAVETGLLAEQDEELNRGFRAFHRLGRPFVHLKIASSLDGRIAAASGDSRWITGEEARKAVHRLRAFYDAVLVGRGCLSADNPSLTVRHTRGRNPRRVLLDSNLFVPEDAAIFGSTPEENARTIIFCAKNADGGKAARLCGRGVTVLPL